MLRYKHHITLLLIAAGLSGCGSESKVPAAGLPPPSIPMEEVLTDAPAGSNVDIIVSEARTRRDQGQLEQSIELYRKALAASVSNDDANAIRIALSRTLTRSGKTHAAIREADIVIRASLADSDSPSALVHGPGSVIAKVNAIAQEEGKSGDTVLSELIDSGPTAQRPLYLYVRASQRKMNGQIAGALADLKRVRTDYAESAWAASARDMIVAIEND